MRKLILLLSLICVCLQGHTQINYVYNGSFEQYWRCPIMLDQIRFCNYWEPIDTINTYPSIGDTFGTPNCTPEFCNACASSPDVGVPINIHFNHFPRTGNGMAQVVMYNTDTNDIYQRDYLQGHLKNTLIAGKQYCITFFVLQEHSSSYSLNKIGAYLDNGAIDSVGNNCGRVQTAYLPQLFSTLIISDTLNWTKIQGVFTANGTEKYITIGNFFDIQHTDTLATLSPIGGDQSAYLVDDVSVIPLDAVANAGPDVTTVVGDSVWIGTNDGYVPCRWYTTAGVLIDSNNAGIYVHPTVTTSYVMELEVCGMYSYDTVKVTVHPTGLTPALSKGEGGVAWVLMPNPARDEVTVRGLTPALSKGEGVAILRDMTGRALGVYELSGSTTGIDISGWAAGVYVVEVSEGGIKTNLRLVKE